jgi:ferric-dicitrate binding protein FerR (iron transport regulator)
MNQIDIHKEMTDRAWECLHARLERDGLLTANAGKRPSGSFRTMAGRAAAVAVFCISAAAVLWISRSQKPAEDMLSLRNTEKATLVTTLEDGSVVYLAGRTRLDYPVRFPSGKREVVLEGDALFDVHENKDYPFFIETKEARIEVTGTSFRVKSGKDIPFELSVKEGEVKVTEKSRRQDCLVRAGQTVRLSSAGPEVSVSGRDDESSFASYTRHIRFKDERLADILRVLNQEVSGVPIRALPSLDDRRLTIGFRENTAEEMVALICLGLRLEYTRENDMFVISSP